MLRKGKRVEYSFLASNPCNHLEHPKLAKFPSKSIHSHQYKVLSKAMDLIIRLIIMEYENFSRKLSQLDEIFSTARNLEASHHLPVLGSQLTNSEYNALEQSRDVTCQNLQKLFRKWPKSQRKTNKFCCLLLGCNLSLEF